LDGVILQSMSMSGSGIVKDDITFKTLQTVMTTGAARNFQITVVGDSTAGGTYAGPFKITSLEMTGAHDGATQFSFSLESQSAITYTAAT
jgi:predicted secreted protein